MPSQLYIRNLGGDGVIVGVQAVVIDIKSILIGGYGGPVVSKLSIFLDVLPVWLSSTTSRLLVMRM